MTRAEAILRLLKIHTGHKQKLESAVRQLAQQAASQARSVIRSSHQHHAEWPALEEAARVARGLPAARRHELLARLPVSLAEEFESALYAFEALPELPSRVAQEVLRACSHRDLALSLIGADARTEAAVLDNVSARAATMIREDRESVINAGEIGTKEVTAARERVAHLIRTTMRALGEHSIQEYPAG